MVDLVTMLDYVVYTERWGGAFDCWARRCRFVGLSLLE